MIKAIETTFRGHQLRTPAHVQWASFFSGVGHEWEYEPAVFNIGEGTDDWFIPTFKVYPTGRPGCYFWLHPLAALPKRGSQIYEHARAVIKHTDRGFYFACGVELDPPVLFEVADAGCVLRTRWISDDGMEGLLAGTGVDLRRVAHAAEQASRARCDGSGVYFSSAKEAGGRG